MKSAILLKTEKIEGDPKYTARSVRWADIMSKAGALYTIADNAGFEMVVEDYLKASFEARGIPVTRSTEKTFQKLAREKRIELFQNLRKQGVPSIFEDLFAVSSKREAEILCRDASFTKLDICRIVYNSNQLGYRHRIKRTEFVPEHLHVSKEDMADMQGIHEGPLDRKHSRAFRKMRASFEERQAYVCHLFLRRGTWHCLYFSFDDVNPVANHWKAGPHVHFTSSLWCPLKPHKLLQLFDTRVFDVPGNLHVRFAD